MGKYGFHASTLKFAKFANIQLLVFLDSICQAQAQNKIDNPAKIQFFNCSVRLNLNYSNPNGNTLRDFQRVAILIFFLCLKSRFGLCFLLTHTALPPPILGMSLLPGKLLLHCSPSYHVPFCRHNLSLVFLTFFCIVADCILLKALVVLRGN